MKKLRLDIFISKSFIVIIAIIFGLVERNYHTFVQHISVNILYIQLQLMSTKLSSFIHNEYSDQFCFCCIATTGNKNFVSLGQIKRFEQIRI